MLAGELLDERGLRAPREEQVQDHPAGGDHALGVGHHPQTVLGGVVACGDHLEPVLVPALPPHVDHAQAAPSPRLQTLVVTQGGNVNAG